MMINLSESVVATEFEGGEGVLVDLDSKRYYQLNETAMFVWRCLEQGKMLPDIVNEMTAQYDVSAEHATTSIERTFKHLIDNQLANAA